MVFVTKADGSAEPYSREKVVRTCLRMGASRREGEEVAERVEQHLFDRISTREIYQMIMDNLRRYRPEAADRVDLKTAVCLLRSKPDWELFVRMLMARDGYRVEGNAMLRGRCIENEVDGVLYRDSETILLEAKHHADLHVKTLLDVPREARSVLEDVAEGCELGYHDVKATGILIACNTKLTEQAERYSDCRGIKIISWKHPAGRGLEDLIEAYNLYPVTLLREVSGGIEAALGDLGIVSLDQLASCDASALAAKSRISEARLRALIGKAGLLGAGKTEMGK